jgi:hypothetical protein
MYARTNQFEKPIEPKVPVDAPTQQVGRWLIVRLRHEAARRDVPVGRLIRDLLDTIVHDQLMAAILDDGELPGA